jgi:magnesium transporter
MLTLFPKQATTPDTAIWIDLFNATDEEIKSVTSSLKVQIPSRADLEEIESSSRLQSEDGWIKLSTPVSAHGDDEGPTPVGFMLSEKFLITIRYTELRGFDGASKLFTKENAAACATDDVFAYIVEGMVDYGADMLEQIGVTLNTLSRGIFHDYRTQKKSRRSVRRTNRELNDALLEIGGSGDRLSQIRESLLGLQRIVPFASEKAKEWMKPEIQIRMKTVSRDLESLADFETHLSNKMQFLLDATLGFINTEQNDIFKVLTIASVVGIPPTFIASMYGMNFHNMPEYSWAYGYQWGLFLIILSTVLPIIWFKWRGWW